VIYRHFVFDLDGTLIDSRQDLADAANAMLATYGAPPLPVPDVVAMVGEGAKVLVTRALTRAGVATDPDEALPRFLDAYDARLTATTTPYPGVIDTLAHLHAVACVSVLTNKPQAHTDRVLAGLGLASSIHRAIGGDSVHGRKPAPDGLQALVLGSGVPGDETLMVGDSWVDVETAVAARVDACLVSYGFGYASVGEEARRAARHPVPQIDVLLAMAPARAQQGR
jgi:phosphoglycolate phosphatase